MFDLASGRWVAMKVGENRYAFDLQPGGGELLCVQGRPVLSPAE